MLDNLLHNHSLADFDERGRRITVRATCAEINQILTSHIVDVPMSDGNGGTRMTHGVVSCADAEAELASLRDNKIHQAVEIGRLNGELNRVTGQLDNANRLMSGAIQVIFGMGPALQGLLSDDLGNPVLTSDRTAVKLESPVYTVIIDVFAERIIVQPAPTVSGVPEKVFRVYNGRLGEDDRTLLLGHVTRIKTVAAGQADPVCEPIELVDQPA